MPGFKQSRVKKILAAKIDDYLDSIEDSNLKDMLSRNIIITGGSVSSLLMGEHVNDYDIYFRNKETALAVAQYYCGKIGVGEVREERRINRKGEEEERIIIYIRSKGSYGSPEEDDGAEEEEVKTKKSNYEVKFVTDNAITMSNKVQLIIRFFGEPIELHANYDFVHCTCSYDYHANKLVVPEAAMVSMLAKELKYIGSLYPIASLFRIRKFVRRGWYISAGEMLKIIWQVNSLDLTNRDVVTDQLIGVDMSYMWQFLEAMAAEQGPISEEFVVKLLDKVFE